MKVLDFYPANCKNCYKCVRNCPVKAIRIVDDQAQIIDEKCIACGKCFLVCPQNARNIHTDLFSFEDALKSRKVIISVAPSYHGIYDQPDKLIGALYGIGVFAVEETAVAAEAVTDLFNRYIDSTERNNYITSCCPSVNLMIKTYYPELSDYLLPIDSPMELHGKMLKQVYGQDAFVVFLGPCISKKYEASTQQYNGIIDAVISFEELDMWLKNKSLTVDDFEPQKPSSQAGKVGGKYPRDGGILPGIKNAAKDKGKTILAVHGFTECMELFDAIKEGQIQNVCVEANICHGACLGGPAIPKNSGTLFERKIRLNNRLNDVVDERWESTVTFDFEALSGFNRVFGGTPYQYPDYSELEIKEVLEKIGKYHKEDELNCGACGYDTCREKAKSVLEGISHLEMCIPNMRMKAERLSNVIFEVSPNILILLDKNMRVVDMNPQGEKAFNISVSRIKGKDISMIMTQEDFKYAIENKENIIGKKIHLPNYNLKLMEYLMYIEEHQLVLGIFSNVTDVEKRSEELTELKLNTLKTVNNVIDRQMRVAQEIAGLLGETTAEAKIALLNLKNIVESEEGEMK